MKHLIISFFGICLISTDVLRAEDLSDVQQIVKHSNQALYYPGQDQLSQTRMLIVDGQGRKQRRQFKLLRRDSDTNDNQDMLVVFSQPSDVRGTVYLVNKHAGEDDDRWLYLPGLDLVKRISAGDNRTSFVGTHAFYEDVSGRWLEDDHHELIETTDQFYVLRHTPKEPNTVEFAEYTTWIDKQNFLPIKIEFKNAAGDVYRRMEVLQHEVFQGFPTVTYGRISDLVTGGYTDIRLRKTEYDKGVPASVFSERSLRNPPKEWLSFSEE